MTKLFPYDGRPLIAGSLLGMRAWNVPFRTGTLLHSIHFNLEWRPGEPMQARCAALEVLDDNWATRIDPSRHGEDSQIPKLNCTCGLYATFNYEELKEQASYISRFGAGTYGVVAGYGHVIAGNLGFRAERMKIIALTNPGLAEQYGVEQVHYRDMQAKYNITKQLAA